MRDRSSTATDMQPVANLMPSMDKILAAESMPQPSDEKPTSTEPVCKVCKQPRKANDWPFVEGCCDSRERDCRERRDSAKTFNRRFFVVPPRFKDALANDPRYNALFSGRAGVGKTYAAYGLCRRYVEENPAAKVAACVWPQHLAMVRSGYKRDDRRLAADEMEEALSVADLAMIDDIGAEKVTDSNHDWITELLYVILDRRYAYCRSTIITTNLEADKLEDYLGTRLASRIMGMCQIMPLEGEDRRIS